MPTQGQQGRGSRKEQQGGKSEQTGTDLKEREYRDKEGNIHHHTRTYMEQHKGEGQSGRRGSERQGGRQGGEGQQSGKSEGGRSEGKSEHGGSGKSGKR